jgi:hypothetical protein
MAIAHVEKKRRSQPGLKNTRNHRQQGHRTTRRVRPRWSIIFWRHRNLQQKQPEGGLFFRPSNVIAINAATKDVEKSCLKKSMPALAPGDSTLATQDIRRRMLVHVRKKSARQRATKKLIHHR